MKIIIIIKKTRKFVQKIHKKYESKDALIFSLKDYTENESVIIRMIICHLKEYKKKKMNNGRCLKTLMNCYET